MKLFRTGARLTAVALLVASVVGGTPVIAATNPGVLPVTTHAHGTGYGELSARWWQWALAGSPATNPVADPTGANCAVRQSGSVWFLAGTFGGAATRSCSVPSGRALFFPVVNTIWANDPGGGVTEQELRDQLRIDLDGATAQAEIDGVAVTNIGAYLVESPPFSLVLEDGNVLGAPSGVYQPAVAGGIHLLLAPLSQGDHVVHFVGCFHSGFCTEATYHLSVTNR
jgi:hypothetical protein